MSFFLGIGRGAGNLSEMGMGDIGGKGVRDMGGDGSVHQRCATVFPEVCNSVTIFGVDAGVGGVHSTSIPINCTTAMPAVVL